MGAGQEKNEFVFPPPVSYHSAAPPSMFETIVRAYYVQPGPKAPQARGLYIMKDTEFAIRLAESLANVNWNVNQCLSFLLLYSSKHLQVTSEFDGYRGVPMFLFHFNNPVPFELIK